MARGDTPERRDLPLPYDPRGASQDRKARVQAGGDWVNDSEPEAEFQETVNKSKAMLQAVALAESFAFET